MSGYSAFARYYDQLTANIDYKGRAEYFGQIIRRFDQTDNNILLDLACGTGSISEEMARQGFDVIGVDLSDEMLGIAIEKKFDSGLNIQYLCQDMREFELYGTVAACISICDSINYITEDDDLLTVFKLVNNYLDPKGILIFDFNTTHYYRDVVADATIAEDREDISFIWDNYYVGNNDINELSLSIFIKENANNNSARPNKRKTDINSENDNLYRKYEEFHLQKGYTLSKIKELINASGLEFVTAYDAFTKNPADENCERIYVIARESGK